MHRVCFTLQVRPDRMDGVRRAPRRRVARDAPRAPRHRLAQLLPLPARGRPARRLPRDADLAAAQAGMARTDVNARWQAEMAEFFDDLDLPPDQGFWQLAEVFHLEDQLAAPPRPARPPTHPLRQLRTDDHRPSLLHHQRPARRTRDRGAVLGLRQLRHPLQGVRHPRHPAHRRGEDRRRRRGAPLHRPRADRGAAHPVGRGRRLRRAVGVRRGAGRRARHDQLQHLPGRRLQARRADPHRPAGAAEGDRPPPRLHRGDARRPARAT